MVALYFASFMRTFKQILQYASVRISYLYGFVQIVSLKKEISNNEISLVPQQYFLPRCVLHSDLKLGLGLLVPAHTSRLFFVMVRQLGQHGYQ
jgi:hypothetical protein